MCRGPAVLVLLALAACKGDFEGSVCTDCQPDGAVGSPDAATDGEPPDASDPCAAVTCDQPPADECTGSILTDYPDTGSCELAGDEPQCEYTASEIDCNLSDQECRGDACADPCKPNPCTSPPAARCSGHNLHTFASPGSCSSPGGVVACVYTETVTNCDQQDQVCSDEAGACVDP
jgi:hypothetical protein